VVKKIQKLFQKKKEIQKNKNLKTFKVRLFYPPKNVFFKLLGKKLEKSFLECRFKIKVPYTQNQKLSENSSIKTF